MKRRRPRWRWSSWGATAAHEAGHAVVALDLRCRMNGVAVIDAHRGWCDAPPPSRGARRERMMREIMVGLAGPIAEQIAEGRRKVHPRHLSPSAAGDLVDASRWAERAGLDIGVMWRRAEAMVRLHWPEVEVLLGALMDVEQRKLGVGEVRRLVRAAR